MTDSAANGRAPGERPGTSHPGAWSAATDPVGQRPANGLADVEPADREPDGELAGGEPDGELAGGEPADGETVGQGLSEAGRGPGPSPRSGSGPGSGREVSRPASRPDRTRRPDARRPGSSGGDLLTDLQRWLIRSSAKTMRREIEGQVRRTLGGGRRQPEDIWGTATTEPPPGVGESPECAWCPICRAARRMRDSGPGLGSQISGASDVVASAVQDAIVAFDAVLSRPPATPQQEPRADRSPHSGRADSAGDEAERAQDEPGDRS
jgi:hypothetical protein